MIMKNKRGFTLVELLGVIVILAILATVAVPSTMSISKKLKVKLYCSKIDFIENAAELYGEDHRDNFTNTINVDEKTYKGEEITVEKLISTSYLKKDQSDYPYIVDPRDKTSDELYKMSLNIYIKNNRIKVSFNDTVNETCEK
jgi:prepilin-type N-terminal cleavage/methylation domain-containing protein